MTEDTVGRLRRLDEEAFGGPGRWVTDAPMAGTHEPRFVGMLPHGDGYASVMAAPDAATAELIVAMRNALPALLDLAELAPEATRHVPHGSHLRADVDDALARLREVEL